MVWYNIFRKKEKAMENGNKYDTKKVPLWERDISGLGEIGDSGFGVIDSDIYFKSEKVGETMKDFKKSKLYQELFTNQYQKHP